MKPQTFTKTFYFSLMLICNFTFAQVQDLNIIGQTPGGGGYVVEWDSTGQQLIVGCGTSIWVYDMSDAHNPVKIKQRPLLGLINETELMGNVLFVGATHDGVYALDYTSPDLDVLAHYNMKEMGDSAAYDIWRSNDTLYVADFYKVRMLKYNSVTTSFSYLGSFGGQRAFGVSRRGNFIAICGQQEAFVSNGKVQIYSINNLNTPVAEWTSPWINWVQDLQFADLSDDIIYVCGGPENALFTKSNLFALQFDGISLAPIDTFPVINGVPGLAQLNIINMDSRNDTLYVATTAAWDLMHLPLTYIPIIDATGLPNNSMEEIGRVTPGLWHFDVALMDGTPYVAMSSEWLGVMVSDISQLAFMDTLGLIPTGGWVNKSKVKDNKLWVCNEGYGLMVYDIDSLNFSNGFWCDATAMHIHSLASGEHFFASDIEFLNDTLIMLNTSRVYNIKPWQMGGSPVLLNDMNKPVTGMQNIHTNTGQRMVATSTDLIKTWIMVFDPFDTQNNYQNFFLDTTNNDFTGFTVSHDTLYYGKKFPNNIWCLMAAKVANDTVILIDSIPLTMPWGLISYHDITGVSVEDGIIAVGYGKQLALFGWNGNQLEELLMDYYFYRLAVDVVLKNNLLYVSDKFYGMKIYDVSSLSSAIQVAQTRGTGGWMNVFGSEAITLDNQGRIYLSDFSAGVILIEAYDTTLVSTPNIQAGSKNSIFVYPNPSEGLITIEIPESNSSSDFQINIYNSVGCLVWQKSTSDSIVNADISGLSKGIYFVHILSKENNYTGKIMVQF